MTNESCLFLTEKFPIDGKKHIDCTQSPLWPLPYDTDLESGHMDGLPALSHKSPSPLVRQDMFLRQASLTCHMSQRFVCILLFPRFICFPRKCKLNFVNKFNSSIFLLRGLYTFRTKNGVIHMETLICIPMYTLEYDISGKKIEIGQSAVVKMDAILDCLSITGASVS